MKTLGLIGGLSWLSTIDYYRRINQLVSDQLGGLHSAKIVLHSIDFEEFNVLIKRSAWDEVAKMLTAIAINLESSGAEAIVICANTPHVVAEKMQERITIPLIHIAAVTADEIVKHQIKKIGLLGTKATMELAFFKERLAEKQVTVLTPNSENRQYIHDAVFNESHEMLDYLFFTLFLW